MPTTDKSLEVVPLVFQRLLSFLLACAAAVKVAGAVFSRHRFGFGSTTSEPETVWYD